MVIGKNMTEYNNVLLAGKGCGQERYNAKETRLERRKLWDAVANSVSQIAGQCWSASFDTPTDIKQ